MYYPITSKDDPMDSKKSILLFIIGVMIIHTLTYVIAGIIAQVGLGVGVYYPPSPNAIIFLRDPLSTHVQTLLIPAQLLRGLLFGIALFSFRKRIMELGQVWGGLAVSSVIFLVAYVAAAGGMIEHIVFFIPIPAGFMVITLVEILLYALMFGQLLLLWEKKFAGNTP